MDPTDPERYNRGVRFSPVANVLRVEVDGKNFLFSPEKHDPTMENGGLAMEFDINTTGKAPVGFAETAMGDGFVKVGVGVLRKDTEQYDFFRGYEPIELARTTAAWGADKARFEQTCAGVNGYAYGLEAEVTVTGNRVEVRCVLRNTGEKAFSTEQYAHNYFVFDGATVGPGYQLQFPFDFEVARLERDQDKIGRTIDFARAFSPEIKSVNAVVAPAAGAHATNDLTVVNPSKGMKVRATTSLPIKRIAVHVTPVYLCPEMFVKIDLEPGEAKEWTRGYEFEANAAK